MVIIAADHGSSPPFLPRLLTFGQIQMPLFVIPVNGKGCCRQGHADQPEQFLHGESCHRHRSTGSIRGNAGSALHYYIVHTAHLIRSVDLPLPLSKLRMPPMPNMPDRITHRVSSGSTGGYSASAGITPTVCSTCHSHTNSGYNKN